METSQKGLILLSGALIGGGLGYLYHLSTQKSHAESKAEILMLKQQLALKSMDGKSEGGQLMSTDILKPPLPSPVVNLLKASQLCYLSTSVGNDPHLSLMNFTYHQACNRTLPQSPPQ